MAIRVAAFAACLLIAACGALTKDLGSAGTSPGAIECKGKFTLSAIGAAQMFGGNGSITGDCGDGAYIRQGMPTSTIP